MEEEKEEAESVCLHQKLMLAVRQLERQGKRKNTQTSTYCKGEKNKMSRSIKKGPFIDPKLQKKVMKQKQMGDKTPIKTWARASQIPPEFVGHTFAVHNGKVFINVFIQEA